jgi:3-dehydroquinate synthase
VIITNAVVAPLYLGTVERALALAGAAITPILVEDGEQAKDWRTLESVFDQLLAARCGRDTVVVALGGGVIGDLAGFAAAVYQRGIPFIQVPTTLLAQVDSSVGGKTAINHPRGKNMVGAFHQPLAVIADIATLDSLPARELRAGLAEVIKHALILDRAFVDWLDENLPALVARERAALAYAVRRSCELKAQVVAEDERETGLRAILNFGHAVSAGMVMAAELSVRAGLLARADAARVRALLERAGLPVSGPALAPERIIELMQVDKKAAGGRLRFVLLQQLGSAVVRGDIDEGLVRDAIVSCNAMPVVASR